MKQWITICLISGASLMTACSNTANTPNKQATKERPILRTQKPSTSIRAVAPRFRDNAPDRYIVKRGDTLWGISGMFLQNPARWREIWHANPKIKNPNKIYPGDVISYVTVGGVKKLQVAGSSNKIRCEFAGRTSDGRPICNALPSVRVEELYIPIPAVPKTAVYPFMTKTLVVEPDFGNDKPYVVGQSDGGFISMNSRKNVYAKTEDSFEKELYDIYRNAEPVNDPVTGEMVGIESKYIGQLKLIKDANEDGVATFVKTDSVNPIYPKDYLVETPKSEIGEALSFFPKLPSTSIDEDELVVIRSIDSNSRKTASQLSTVLINGGSDNGIETGDVFNIVKGKKMTSTGRDGDAFTLPDYEVGMGIVYKTLDDVSYLLIMNATDVIYSGDRLVSP